MRFRSVGAVMGVSAIAIAMLVAAQADDGKDGSRLEKNDREIKAHAERLLEQGRNIFRFETYGSEAFFGDALQLHRASLARIATSCAGSAGLVKQKPSVAAVRIIR